MTYESAESLRVAFELVLPVVVHEWLVIVIVGVAEQVLLVSIIWKTASVDPSWQVYIPRPPEQYPMGTDIVSVEVELHDVSECCTISTYS